MIHELKIFTEFFAAVACGVKRAELRKNDRNYQVGDTLHLCEFNQVTGMRTGECINVTVTHIADVGAWLPGYVLLSVELVDNPVHPVPVASDADPSFDAMMRALDAFYADDDVPERAMPAAFRILLADVREKPALVVTDDIMEEINRWAINRCLVGRKHYTQQQNALIDAYIGLTEPKAPVVTDDRLLENLETRIRSLEIGERKGALNTQQETSLKAYRLAVQCLRSPASSDENATDNTAQQFEALVTSGKSEHLLNAERIAREAKALPDRLNDTSAVHPRVSGWSERQQKVIAYSLWRFSCAAYQKANQAAQTNNKDMFDRFIRDARCAEEIREEFTSAWVGKL